MNARHLFEKHRESIQKIIRFFTAKAVEPSFFDDIQNYRKANALLFEKYVPNFQICLAGGLFTVWDFIFYENWIYQQRREGACPPSLPLIHEVLRRMCNANLLREEVILQSATCKIYQLNEALAKTLAACDSLYNPIFGFSFIADKYAESVVKIVVENRAGDANIGTGFLYRHKTANTEKSLVITNKHVAEHPKLKVITRSNRFLQHAKVVLGDVTDLAAIELVEVQKAPHFFLYSDCETLDEVVSIGYPKVAMSREAYQLAHRGEINSVINDYKDNSLILFSAKTSPGNSGGPLLNELGFVVGVITRDLFYKEAQHETGQLPYHAAIPASQIDAFLASQFPKDR